MSLLLVRYDFPGKRALYAMIDVPLAVSPVVVGLALVLVYNGRYGWFGPTLEDHGLQVVFALPGMIMATTFVALPLVIREVVPVLEDMGDDQEQAARSLGANAWQTFRRITLPGIKWAIVYGVVLSLARSLGEFGAVKVVAGNVGGETTDRHRPGPAEVPELRTGDGVLHRVHARRRRRAVPHRRRPAASEGERFMSIEVRNVSKRFGDFVALDDVTVSLPTGQLTALLGPSGGGKSTLLRIIAGLDSADERHDQHRGHRGDPPAGAEAQRRLRVPALRGLQAHDGGQERRLRPGDPQAAQGRDRAAGSTSCSSWCTSSSSRDRLPSQLSGGQRQRMALARALAVEPKVLLLDEPFGALDAKVRKELRDWLRRLHDEVHVTTVFVTHDQEEALEVADEIVVINEGRVEQIGTPDELYDDPANDFVMGFLGEVTTRQRPAGPSARHRRLDDADPGRRRPGDDQPDAAHRLRGAGQRPDRRRRGGRGRAHQVAGHPPEARGGRHRVGLSEPRLGPLDGLFGHPGRLTDGDYRGPPRPDLRIHLVIRWLPVTVLDCLADSLRTETRPNGGHHGPASGARRPSQTSRVTGSCHRSRLAVEPSPVERLRHCWVTADEHGRVPALLLEWRQTPDGWQGRAVRAVLRPGTREGADSRGAGRPPRTSRNRTLRRLSSAGGAVSPVPPLPGSGDRSDLTDVLGSFRGRQLGVDLVGRGRPTH